jgi:hypothetical protein
MIDGYCLIRVRERKMRRVCTIGYLHETVCCQGFAIIITSVVAPATVVVQDVEEVISQGY